MDRHLSQSRAVQLDEAAGGPGCASVHEHRRGADAGRLQCAAAPSARKEGPLTR